MLPDAAQNVLDLGFLALGDGVAVHALIEKFVEHVPDLAHILRNADRAGAARLDDVIDKRIDTAAVARAETGDDDLRQLALRNDPGADGVVQIVVQVRHMVAQPHDDRLAALLRMTVRVGKNADARLLAEIETFAVLLDAVHDAQRLLIVAEAGTVNFVERPLPGVPERRMAEVMPQRPSDGAGKARHLERVGEPCAVMVALRLEKDLRFVLETAERLRVRDAVGVALEARAHGVLLLEPAASAGIGGTHAVVSYQNFFQLLAFLPRTGHALRLLKTKK